MITITYLLCIALKGMQWPLWGMIGTGVLDSILTEAWRPTVIKLFKNETKDDRPQ